jgi:hypothetical protein
MQICNCGEETTEPPPVMGEAENAIEKLSKNKSPGLDNLQAELLKYVVKQWSIYCTISFFKYG